MTEGSTTRISMDEILRRKAEGKIRHDPNAPEGPPLGPEFWERAFVEEPLVKRSVHLKLDYETFQHFQQETGGKGHITRMQNVLRAYVKAQKAAAEKRLAKG